MGELQALLEIKRRKGGNKGGIKMATSLEEAAEFEYLKNILYQYMVGKETQVLGTLILASSLLMQWLAYFLLRGPHFQIKIVKGA